MRARHLAAAVFAASMATHGAARAQEGESPATPRKNAVTIRVDAGPAYRNLDGHSVVGAEVDAGLGVEFGRIQDGARAPAGSLYGAVGILHGDTDEDLRVTGASVAAVGELVFGRFRPQLFIEAKLVSVQRFTSSERMQDAGVGLGLAPTFDLVRVDILSLYVGARGELAVVGQRLPFAGASLKLGGRFSF
jgi:hypothetical protein